MQRKAPDYQLTQDNKKQKQEKIHGENSRRNFFLKSIIGIGSVLSSFLYSRFEANWLEITRKKIQISSIQSKNSIKLLHLSDLHFSNTVSLEDIDFALHSGYSLSPDLCVMTGDFITSQKSGNELKKMSLTLSKYARKVPTFASLGNHDGGDWSASRGGPKNSLEIENMLRQSGIRLLHNQRESIYLKGNPISIAGVGDLWSNTCLPQKCLSKITKESGNTASIVLCHNPDSKELLANYKWDLMLCGHTHGGQLKIPFVNWTPFAPVKDHTMVEGLHNWKGRQIHITRGVGNLWGLRFNCRPEISLLDISST